MIAAVRSGVRLGVDVGSVRIGVAACDAHGVLAVPVETVKRERRTTADVDRIAAIAAEREAIEIVVGLPQSLSGREGQAADAARTFALQLVGFTDVPVRMVDERMSTVQAEQAMRSAGMSTRQQRGVVDQAAAVVILQLALDAERSRGAPPGELVHQP